MISTGTGDASGSLLIGSGDRDAGTAAGGLRAGSPPPRPLVPPGFRLGPAEPKRCRQRGCPQHPGRASPCHLAKRRGFSFIYFFFSLFFPSLILCSIPALPQPRRARHPAPNPTDAHRGSSWGQHPSHGGGMGSQPPNASLFGVMQDPRPTLRVLFPCQAGGVRTEPPLPIPFPAPSWKPPLWCHHPKQPPPRQHPPSCCPQSP